MALIGVASAAVERRKASPLRVSVKERKIRRGRPHPPMRLPKFAPSGAPPPFIQGRTKNWRGVFGDMQDGTRMQPHRENESLILPAIAGRDELLFADLAQDFGGVFAQPRGGAFGSRRRAVEHDRRAQSGDSAAFGGVAFQVEPHAAMHDLRIGEDLAEIVDRARRNAGAFELVEKIVALELRGQRRQLADQFGAMRQPALIVLIFRHFGDLRLAENAAQLDELAVVAGGDDDSPSATGNA